MFLLVNLHIDMGLEAVLPGPQNALYDMIMIYTRGRKNWRFSTEMAVYLGNGARWLLYMER